MDSHQQAHVIRMVRLAILWVIAELAVFAVGHVAPAMTTLLGPVYALVAVLFLFALWHAARRRPGQERRHNHPGDRRHRDRRD